MTQNGRSIFKQATALKNPIKAACYNRRFCNQASELSIRDKRMLQWRTQSADRSFKSHTERLHSLSA